jgi:anaerobic dimethyl sulfoxide reductase subunit C (anchor subunit)
MNIREFALITFTILGQMAAGSMLVLMIIRAYLSMKAKIEEVDNLLDGPLFIVVPIMGLALLASLMHLNNLANVVKAVPNLDSSWLSREVVFSVIFVVLAVIYTFMQWRKLGGHVLRALIGWVTALVGLVQTYAMGMVYMLRTQPAWNTVATPITFFVTSLLLGGLAVAVALMVNQGRTAKKDSKAELQRQALLRQIIQGIAMGSLILIGVEFIVLPIYMAYLSTQGSSALQSLMLMVGPFFGILIFRLVLIFVGAGILGAYLYRNAGLPGGEKSMAALTYSAFVLVLIGEVMGRILFYASHVRIGL